MLNYAKAIEKVTAAVLTDEINYGALQLALHEFKTLLIKLTGVELNKQNNREDIHFENGIALSTTFAALCLDDIIRTRQFMRGVLEAAEKKQRENAGPLHILYAGTGPFATLILPLLTKYTSAELQLTLLVVNEETVKYLERTIQQLGIEAYVEKIVCADASKYKLENDAKVDILISETMQCGLVKEQQVPIMLNLVQQLEKEVIVIPQKIQLDLALMNSSSKLLYESNPEGKYKVLKRLLEFDKAFMKSRTNRILPANEKKSIELCKAFVFNSASEQDYDKLVILTSINVFGDEWVKTDRSSLTIPKVLLHQLQAEVNTISLDYVIKSIPDFEYQFN